MVDWLGLYGISTFVGYLTPNPFLFKQSVLVQIIQFCMGSQLNCQKYFYFKFSQTVLIQVSISTDFVYTLLNAKIVLYQINHFSVSTVSMSKNSSISNNSV